MRAFLFFPRSLSSMVKKSLNKISLLPFFRVRLGGLKKELMA